MQESLTNELKHGSGPATVRLDWRRSLHVTVDNPVAVDAPERPAGSGILGMQQRVAAAGGHLVAGLDADRWRVRAVLPLDEGAG